MELLCFIASLLILSETSFLTVNALKKRTPKTRGKRKIYVDTSSLMDGRILEVAKTGFLSDDLIIPRSVIRELQLLADEKDSEKRTRARFGMDVANELERVVYFNTEILQDALDRTPVDERLLSLAKENNGIILTCDFNLSKVAATEKIETLNINDLALVLRNEFLPGEKFVVKITTKGSNPKQGIGYLKDGTMVVVDNAAKKIGQELEVYFVRFLQTSSGKMIFANQRSSRKNSSPKAFSSGRELRSQSPSRQARQKR